MLSHGAIYIHELIFRKLIGIVGDKMKISVLAIVSGNVQGVFFRASSQQTAIDHSLSGYARNLADGTVEVLMCGEQDNVNKMLKWLNIGSEQAEVENVQAKEVAWQSTPFFSID